VKATGTLDLRPYFSAEPAEGEPLRSGLEEVVIKTFIESKEPEGRIKALIDAVADRGVTLTTVRDETPMRLRYRLNSEKID
jgi:hypothetical protein